MLVPSSDLLLHMLKITPLTMIAAMASTLEPSQRLHQGLNDREQELVACHLAIVMSNLR